MKTFVPAFLLVLGGLPVLGLGQCPEDTEKSEYTGSRKPPNTGWKVPVQILGGYMVGGALGSMVYDYWWDSVNNNNSSDTGGVNAGGIHTAIPALAGIVFIFYPVFAVTSTVPVFVIGNLGNERTPFGYTLLGSVLGIFLPGANPIVATVFNRSFRRYKYECIDNNREIPKAVNIGLFDPQIEYDVESHQFFYKLSIIQVSF